MEATLSLLEHNVVSTIFTAFSGSIIYIGYLLQKYKEISLGKIFYVLSTGILCGLFVSPVVLKWLKLSDADESNSIVFLIGMLATFIIQLIIEITKYVTENKHKLIELIIKKYTDGFSK